MKGELKRRRREELEEPERRLRAGRTHFPQRQDGLCRQGRPGNDDSQCGFRPYYVPSTMLPICFHFILNVHPTV